MAEQKNILVVVPVNAEQRARFEEAVAGGKYDCTFTYVSADLPDRDKLTDGSNYSIVLMRDVAEEDLAGKHVIIGAVPPSMLLSADALEWLQLSWAGADAFCSTDVLPAQVLLTNASGAYGLSCSEHLLALTFALIRNIPEYVRNQEQHDLFKSRHIVTT